MGEKNTAHEVWESLKVRYLGANRVQRAQLQSLNVEFENLHMKQGETMGEFFGMLRTIACKYTSLGLSPRDANLVYKLIESVPKKYDTVAAGIDQFCD